MASEPTTAPASDAKGALDEIQERLGFVPLIYRQLAARPQLLASTWDEHRRLLLDGSPEARCRCCVALATAVAQGCRYWIDFYTAMLHKAGLEVAELDGLVATIRFASGAAALTNGMGLGQAVDPDLLPYLPHRGRPL